MSDDYQEFVAAARTIRKANAMLGNGEHAPWTADDFFDLASSVAAEAGTVGRCPICDKEVHSNSSARVQKHLDGVGKICVASGQWFYVAVAS